MDTPSPCELFLLASDRYDGAKRELDRLADRLAPAADAIRKSWNLAKVEGEDVQFDGLPTGFRVNGDWPSRKMIATAITAMKKAEEEVKATYNALSENHKRRVLLPWIALPT
jgi:hypothetical protein